LDASGANGRARGRVRGQAGLTLIELLIAVVILAVLSVSGTLGLITLIRTSSQADLQSRTDALVTGFGELLKQLDYVPCADGPEYGNAFEDYEDALAPSEKLLQRPDASIEILAVDAGDRCDDGIDAGVQVIDVRARIGDLARTAQIVKRDPNASPDGPIAVIDPEVPQSAPGDLLYTVSLTAKGSSATMGIFRLDWDCGDSAYTDDSHFRTHTTYAVDEAVLCTFPSAASASTAQVELTVTDNALATASDTRTIDIPAWSASPTPPTASFTYTQTSSSNLGPDYNPSTVVFDASGSMSPGGSDLTYLWNFGDSASGNLNTSTALKPTHVYYAPGTYTVTLTVKDDIGLYSTTSRTVTVRDSGKVAPVVTFTATPSTGVVTQTVSFNSAGTQAKATGATLSAASYQWNFGDGQVGSGPSPSHTYTNPGTYTVTLTVTDSLGNTAATARTVTMGALTLPSGFTMYDAAGELFHDGHFYFAWTNVARSPGDSISYEIEVKAVVGCLAFGTQTRTVPAGPAGEAQTYDFRVSWPASNVCLGSTYQYRVRTKRVSPTNGTSYSAWSPYGSKTISHT
jgi:prepilin-type N-terminal cleavage/methylation domain-containing protein